MGCPNLTVQDYFTLHSPEGDEGFHFVEDEETDDNGFFFVGEDEISCEGDYPSGSGGAKQKPLSGIFFKGAINANGALATYTGPDGITYSYIYDEANRLTSIDIPGKGPILFNSYKWNSPLQMTFPGGASVHYEYDGLMRPTKIESLDPIGQLIAKREYEYNSVGNITVKNTETGVFGYGYDPSRFLSSVGNPDGTSETFTYDLLGNRLEKRTAGNLPAVISYSYNADNQLLSTSQATYEYDNNGNLTRKTAGGIIYDYIWNVKGQLVEVKENGATIATYAYDPFGRRISKTVNGTKTYFAYNAWGLCGEYDVDGNELRSYGYSPSSMAPLFLRQNGEIYYYLNDHLGTPQKIISGSGRVVWSAVYGAFGKALVSVQEIENNFRFPGQYYDTETGLHYNFFRYYDTETGRYISVDPARDGINFYAYCKGNPLNFSDPYGLCAVKAAVNDALAAASAFAQGALYAMNSVTSSGSNNIVAALGNYSEAGIKAKKYDEVYNTLAGDTSGEGKAEAAMIARTYVNTIFNEREKGRTVGGDDNGNLWYGDGNRWYHRKRNRSWICDEWMQITRDALDKSTTKTKYFKNGLDYTSGHMWDEITRKNEDGSTTTFKLDPWHTAYPDISEQ